MVERVLTPSKITAWLECPHFLELSNAVDDGVLAPGAQAFGGMARMLREKGLAHEAEVLVRYREAGREVFEVPSWHRGEPFADWVERVGPSLDAGHEVLYQMPFVHDGVRGIADFLELVHEDAGGTGYEPVDAKLARAAAKPGHVLQLCFYAEAIAARIGHVPARLHVELGSGVRETIRTAEVLPYWRRQRHALAALLAQPPAGGVPDPCGHCAFCEFAGVCDDRWRAADSLVFVAGIRAADWTVLEGDGVTTLADLAVLDRPVDEIVPDRLERLIGQARLQVQARDAAGDAPPPFELLCMPDPDGHRLGEDADEAGEDPITPTLVGFPALPEPDDGDVFLDLEGHPFWRADVGLFFLFGLIEYDDVEWRYRAFWAHDRAEEAQAVRNVVTYLTQRRDDHPGMHVYHYNHTERSALTRLAALYAVAELDLERLVGTGAFVDLYPVVTGSLRIGTESYGLKQVERLTGFERSHDIDRGAGAVIEYEAWTRDHDRERLDRIAQYNEDDVRATLAVRNWLVAHRPANIPWRPAVLDPEPADPELDARIEALHAYGAGTGEHVMGDLLGYWRRERRVVAAECLRLSTAAPDEQREHPSVIADLAFQQLQDGITPTGRKSKWQAAVFTFPPQPVDPEIAPGSKLILALQPNTWAFYTVAEIDRDTCTLALTWNQEAIDRGIHPPSLVHWVRFDETNKQAALTELADRMLHGDATTVGHAILRRDPPRFHPGGGPRDAVFAGEYEDVCAWVPQLDDSYLPVQGPPGTGKTFTGAHLIRSLVTQGLRVGVTAMSHNAVDNLLHDTVARFGEAGATLRAVHKATGGTVPGVTYLDNNAGCADGPFDVVAGTPWLFASPAMRQHPVDILIVDEAGQLGLADTLAATVSATDVVLLGDPQQLPQVAQAVHPNRSGVSALEHLLGPDAHTFPPDRGLLLDVTRRMHSDVCRFVSEVMYDGRLTSHPDCEQQTTSAGTGLRWIRADHTARSTESPEEGAVVAATIRTLLGTDWTDAAGTTRPLDVGDIIVVTPYNDQRRLITATLADDPAIAGVQVGTVDKFQGREAAVVVFSMATSSADFMPHDADFLFSKNRLNVAVSRARCLAYLVCTEDLLDTRARDVDQMKLIGALCTFVEHAQPV